MPETPLLNTDVVFVLGMHRSGTSCLMGLLHASGVRMLDRASKAKPTNPRGNFEYREVRDLNDEIFQQNGGTWREPPETITVSEPLRRRAHAVLSQVAGQGLWGLKDPRMLFMLDAWRSQVQSSHLLGIFRHPLAVARSLADRKKNRLPVEDGLALWLAYNRRLVDLHKRDGLPLLCFDLDPEAFLGQVAWAVEQVGLRVDRGVLQEHFQSELVHHRQEVMRSLTGELGEVYRYLWTHRVIPGQPTDRGRVKADRSADSATLRRADGFQERAQPSLADPPPLDPIWPLPRPAGGPSDEQIREALARYSFLHYAYAFEGGLSFSTRYINPPPHYNPEPPLQRFRHFMPYVVASQQGSLAGKRVLDIACNAGFWSIQCALLGAEVVGFDGRPELIEQANLIKSIVGLNTVTFDVLDFWDMSPETLGTFDVVLSLGILYHLPEPLAALRRTKAMARDAILLDTGVYPSEDALVLLHWEEPDDIRRATTPGIVARPSKKAVELMLRHLGVAEWYEIPLGTTDMPRVYLQDKRASWLITV